jgi:hypothetical protein
MIKWLKSLFCRKKTASKKVLEKVCINKHFKKKNACSRKKKAK